MTVVGPGSGRHTGHEESIFIRNTVMPRWIHWYNGSLAKSQNKHCIHVPYTILALVAAVTRCSYRLNVVKLVFAGGPSIATPLGPSSLESGQKVTV